VIRVRGTAPSKWLRAIAMAAAGALLLAACTGGGTPKPTPPTPRRGGSVVFGAEQWTDCLNPITACAASWWTHYAVLQHVLPRAMQFDTKGNLVASELLVEAPTLDNGGLTQSPFTVRFRIDPQAVWDDGSRITSADFEFTWRAVEHTVGAYYEHDAYELIEEIDSTDPQIAVVKLGRPLAKWGHLFGGPSGYVLKEAAFPKAGERPNLKNEMQRVIAFSGGPFRLEHWDAEGRQGTAILVRNDRYWGKQPLLDRVTFLATLDQTEETDALTGGRVAAIFPQPTGPGFLQRFKKPDMRAVGGDGLFFEALWFGHATKPMDGPRVREALMYAIDRQAIVDRLIKPINSDAQVLNCGFVAFPALGPWCHTRPFDRFNYDPARARGILESDGYDCAATFCVKDGKLLEIEIWSSMNPRRIATQSIVVDHAREAGFNLKPRNYGSTGVHSLDRFQITDFATYTSGDPSVTETFGCEQIPSNENGYQGYNWSHWCNAEADRLMQEADREIDPQRRLTLMERIYERQAQDFVSLPLYLLPAVSAWRTDKIAGPIGLYSSTPYGMFFNMNEWYVPPGGD